jgi:hypothetical protein
MGLEICGTPQTTSGDSQCVSKDEKQAHTSYEIASWRPQRALPILLSNMGNRVRPLLTWHAKDQRESQPLLSITGTRAGSLMRWHPVHQCETHATLHDGNQGKISDDVARDGPEREPIQAPCGFMGSVDLHCTAAPGIGPARGIPAHGSALTAVSGSSSSSHAVS